MANVVPKGRPISVIAQDLSSPYTQKLRKKKTIIWWSSGKRKRRG